MPENKSRAIVYKVHSELVEMLLVSSEIQGVLGINMYTGQEMVARKMQAVYSGRRIIEHEDFQRRNKPKWQFDLTNKPR